MKNLKLLTAYLFITVLFFSCSSDSDEIIPSVEFYSVSVSQDIAFTDTPITLNINGSHFTTSELVFTNQDISYTKIDEKTYEITASKAVLEQININLINGNDIQSKSVILEFVEHGVFESRMVEGIEIDVDNSDKLLQLLGEPDGKTELTSNTAWVYGESGVTFFVTNGTNIINYAYIDTYERVISTDNNTSVLLKAYPYLINGIFDFSDVGRNKMDDIVNELGLPTFTYTGASLPNPLTSFKDETTAPTATSRGLYRYLYFHNYDPEYGMGVRFYANSIDGYTGENISYIVIY